MVKNIGLILVVITLVNSATIKHKVFPEPKTFTESDKLLLLDPCQFEISHNQQNAKIDVEPIIKVYKSRIFGDALSCEKLAGIQYKKTLKINISVDLDQYLHPNIEETDESYCISLSEDEMLIEANQYPGLVHALETFSRLIKASKSNKGLHEIENTPITVKDAPRFPYRGIMLDSARHFIGVASIMRTIDAMVMSKMSVLHWHLIDDDSWSIESLSYPNLTSYAAFDQTQIYFKNEIQKVVSYATIRAIRIVPEFDNPGHTRSVGMDPSFLPLVAGFSIQDEYRMPSGPLINGGPPTGVLNPALNQSFTFLQNILTDFNTQFPDNLVHLGGDEVLFYCWNSVPSIAAFMQQNKIPSNEALMNYWVNKARGILTSINANKTAIYWSNEDTYYLQVKPTDYLEFWGFTSNLTQLATLYPNNKIIISPGDRFYLDCGMGNKYGGNSWCDPYHTWYSIYTLEPTQYLSASQVLGGEVVMFGELVNDFVIDGKIWPRAAAMADRFWNENVALNVTAVIGRLQALYDTMTYHGIGASPITGHYCEKNLNFCFSSPN